MCASFARQHANGVVVYELDLAVWYVHSESLMRQASADATTCGRAL